MPNDGLGAGAQPPGERAEVEFHEITTQLRSSIKRERWIATVVGLLAVTASVAAILLLLELSKQGLEEIQTTDDPSVITATTVYLLVRGAAFAGLIAGILYAIFALARSALDQATRFDKRLIAARFIEYAVHSEGVTADKMKLALEVLEAWGASVESAYTPSKVASKRAEVVKVNAGKDGLGFEHSSSRGGD